MKLLHTCWLVDSWKPSREKYLRAWGDAGWHVVLWDMGQLGRTPLDGVELLNAEPLMHASEVADAFAFEMRHRAHMCAADLFRFVVLHELGGSYADLDILPKNARAADAWPLFGQPQGCKPANQIPAFGRPHTAELAAESLEIRFVSSPKAHPLIARITAAQALNEHKFAVSGGYLTHGIDQIVLRTGPMLVAAVARGYAMEVRQPYTDFLIQGATVDATPENDKEHMTLRYPEMLRLAKGGS